MQATTNDARLAPGVELIAELHTLRAEVRRQAILLNIYRRAADEAAEQRAAAQEAAQAQAQSELEAYRQFVERLARRDYANNPYLRRIYGR